MRKTVIGVAIGMLVLGFAGGFASGWGYNNSSFHAAETTPLSISTQTTSSADNSFATSLNYLIHTNILDQIKAQLGEAPAISNLPLQSRITNFFKVASAQAQANTCQSYKINLSAAMQKAINTLITSPDNGCKKIKTTTRHIHKNYLSKDYGLVWSEDETITTTFEEGYDTNCKYYSKTESATFRTVMEGRRDGKNIIWTFLMPPFDHVPSDAVLCSSSDLTEVVINGTLDRNICPNCVKATPIITPGA